MFNTGEPVSLVRDVQGERLRTLVTTSGARQRCETLVEELEKRAGAVLEGMELPPEAKEALAHLSARATHRST